MNKKVRGIVFPLLDMNFRISRYFLTMLLWLVILCFVQLYSTQYQGQGSFVLLTFCFINNCNLKFHDLK